MKRSKKIVLAIVASATLTACGSETRQTSRDLYPSQKECVDDWGQTNCEETQVSNTRYYRGPHYYYIGGHPYYYPRTSMDPDPVRASAVPRFKGATAMAASPRATTTLASSVSRGGFGSFFRGGS